MKINRLYLLLPALLAGCEQAPPPEAPIPRVRVISPLPAESAAGQDYSGEIRARYEVPLGFRVGGKVLERQVDAGMRVNPGQMLARLDPADLELQLSQSQAQFALAAADAKRYRELREKNFVSAAALEAKETALATAKAQAGIAANQSAYARLLADRAGVVTAVLAEPGQVVSAGQAVVRLALDGEPEVALALPETELADVRVGTPAQVRLWSGARTYRGHVREIAAAADAATRTFALRVALDDADGAMALGMSASVSFPGSKPEGVVLPLAAVFQQGEQPAVWVVTDRDKVELRPVTVAQYTDQGAVVSAGLEGKERIVAAGVHKLTQGQQVRIAP